MAHFVFTEARRRALKKAQAANKRGHYKMTTARRRALKKAQAAARRK